MRSAVAVAALSLLVAGCTGNDAERDDAAGAALEQAAIGAGVVRDPATRAIAGLYGRDTDRVCVVAAGGGHRIGASIDYGNEGCSARGTLSQRGETLSIAFDDAPGCAFDARLEQDRIVFPGALPSACERLCTDRASFAALEVDLLSEAASEASDLRDRKGRALCGS